MIYRYISLHCYLQHYTSTVGNRCRLDIKTVVAFLCTRVASPDEDDWKKLRRVLQYLRGTIDLKLTLGADDITKMESWVDV